jgi:hypothetical protein
LDKGRARLIRKKAEKVIEGERGYFELLEDEKLLDLSSFPERLAKQKTHEAKLKSFDIKGQSKM